MITANVFYEKWEEWEAPMSPEDVMILPKVTDALSRLQKSGFLLFIVSNQGAFAKGKTTLESLITTAAHVATILREAGIVITEEYYSFTHPQGVVKDFSGVSLERKPSPYFLYIAAATYNVDLSNSWIIGDRPTDVFCGKAANCRTLQILDEHGKSIKNFIEPNAMAPTLYDAASIILEF